MTLGHVLAALSVLLMLRQWGTVAAMELEKPGTNLPWSTSQPGKQRVSAGPPVKRSRRGDFPASETVCPYKVIPHQGRPLPRDVCFRTTDSSFYCDHRLCKVFRSGRTLVANVLPNSNSVLLQWEPPGLARTIKGFYMNCSWNGTFTRFQCDSVQLGTSCRDFLLTNVHDNVKYRICLQTLHTDRTSQEECVEFSVEPVGMQEIVIAMTAVGGSICVMLVIICLLVAYITENLMHPTFTHPSAKRGP
ncbi:hypothetical protein GDO86_012662 [Hymenochirus boettgeri]|uniref:Fibronectin type III domain containing 10 n=1 Tax=Hymenochirus boettgeri TaxID=247094 RepID=A0A8T2ITI1_9PIPI|nr:hypothetical protein GDO86_012662 [Hymenochirus boettgeri]